jgi:amino acid transporter
MVMSFLWKPSTALAGAMADSLFSLAFSGTPLQMFADSSVSWVMTDYDATAHITEEMKNPAVKAPVAILAALGTTYVLGFGLNIALSVCMGSSWPDLLSTPTGLPVAQLLYNVLGRRGGVAFVSLAAAICNFTGASCLQAQARTAFALSRGNRLDVFNCR